MKSTGKPGAYSLTDSSTRRRITRSITASSRTREEDGDPIDVVVITQLSVVPMSIIRSRPLGMLVTEDEKGRDVKIVAAPLERIEPYYAGVDDVSQLPRFTRNQIETFFKQYKELEPTKFVKIVGWEGKREGETENHERNPTIQESGKDQEIDLAKRKGRARVFLLSR